ncbi:MAG TPA: class I SAM-dependent methyltransferase [Rugosimonospora sp.]|nr:class I SAM-dependent methyltransferase [Rugosimonospora sp.]
MLTVDFARLPVRAGARVIDIGSGAGRHSFEAYRRGADIVALDRDRGELAGVTRMFHAMAEAGEAPPGARATALVGDALQLPFPDGFFDCVIASEVLEHIPDDARAIDEIARVVKPGGTVAVSVPRWFPERVCWALSDAYFQVEGGHVRIYRAIELVHKLCGAGLRPVYRHHAHALHSPYWWLKCAVGVNRDRQPLVRAYHRFLVWDLMRRPWLTRTAERVLDPVLGKSVVVYLVKPEVAGAPR